MNLWCQVECASVLNISTGKAIRITVSHDDVMQLSFQNKKLPQGFEVRSWAEGHTYCMSFTIPAGFLIPLETEHHQSLSNRLTKLPWSTQKHNNNRFWCLNLTTANSNFMCHECAATWDDKVLQWITCLWCSCDALVCSWPNLVCYLQWGDPWPQYIGLPDWNNQLPVRPI